MIIALLLIGIALLWMFVETECLSIRLPYGSKQSGIRLLNPGKTEKYLALPRPSFRPSEFVACDLDNTEYQSKTIVNIGAKILY